jgi:hypothetical protein
MAICDDTRDLKRGATPLRCVAVGIRFAEVGVSPAQRESKAGSVSVKLAPRRL